MSKSVPITAAILGGLLLVAGVLFWPTLYRYDKVHIGQRTMPVRMHRVTGYTEHFDGKRWIPAEGNERKIRGRVLPFVEAAKITGNASLSGYGSFSGKLYNGGTWSVTAVKFRVKALEASGEVRWDREFFEHIDIPPFSTASFSVSVTGDYGDLSVEWGIEEAYGEE